MATAINIPTSGDIIYNVFKVGVLFRVSFSLHENYCNFLSIAMIVTLFNLADGKIYRAFCQGSNFY
jgi:hypothetical protein